MSWASSLLTSSRALTSISKNVALGWDRFQAVISPMISSLTSCKRFSSCMCSLLFLFVFQNVMPSRLFPLWRMLWVALAKPSLFYLFFRSFATSPVQKNDLHPFLISPLDNLLSAEIYFLCKLTNQLLQRRSRR